MGWIEYKEWIEGLFDLAPPAPDCNVVKNFSTVYNNSGRFVKGALILSRNKEHNAVFALDAPAERMGGRQQHFAKMWEKANLLRNLPPNLEMLVYVNDKPRVHTDLGLPAFTISGEFPAGSGMPLAWKNYLPFPSHFYDFLKIPKKKDLPDFESKRPVVFFRGRFSEHAWSSFETSSEWQSTPRFKLALGTSNPSDSDVLDVKLTGFAAAKEPLVSKIRKSLKREHNISMETWTKSNSVQSRYVLAVSGNGWAGATAMRSLLSGACTLFVHDNSTDYEGYTRDLGEIYFPLMKSGRDFVPVDYDSIAHSARALNANPEEGRQISDAGFRFAEKFLGLDCALDLIELLGWRYYKYVSTGCPTAFSHVTISSSSSGSSISSSSYEI
jgi:hypothetical protein